MNCVNPKMLIPSARIIGFIYAPQATDAFNNSAITNVLFLFLKEIYNINTFVKIQVESRDINVGDQSSNQRAQLYTLYCIFFFLINS